MLLGLNAQHRFGQEGTGVPLACGRGSGEKGTLGWGCMHVPSQLGFPTSPCAWEQLAGAKLLLAFESQQVL